MVLLDTTVLVDALRGHSEALRYIEQLPDRPAISSVTVAELYAGVRVEEEEALHQFISIFNVFPVDASVAQRAGYWRRDFGPGHGTSLTDAMIAATAETQGAELATHNTKHFPMLEHVRVPY
jgi:hypothetical protein